MKTGLGWKGRDTGQGVGRMEVEPVILLEMSKRAVVPAGGTLAAYLHIQGFLGQS